MRARRSWKAGVALGLLGLAGLLAGCNERQNREVRQDARQAGRQVGEAARDVGDATREAVEGFKEGVGGSGQKEIEQPAKPGEKKTLRHDGQGPLE
ncbi:hypothetical protein [Melittangium boletus]|uniref:Latency associated antigen n=1 Tax=Melittangium boletus DSM 14713 TaxID=1294270 RepID=A0A250IPU3_9BACT|nr:hypothetical protein [Melittangium boletus]ATB33779.1 latency associated antigen [Melittangium boletus DSM 14713]